MITTEIKLNIIYKFKDFEYLVYCSDNNFWQLEHFEKRTKPLRKLNLKRIGGSKCILINRKPITLSSLREKALKTFEFIKIGEINDCLF